MSPISICARNALLWGFLFASSVSQAQPKTANTWLPAPHIDLKDNYSPPEKKELLKPDGTTYYAFDSTPYSSLAFDQLYQPPGWADWREHTGENAFRVLAPQSAARVFALIPQRSDVQGKTLNIFNLKRIEQNSDTVNRQVFYLGHDSVAWFHSPTFSPDGKSVLVQDGYLPGDMNYAANLFVWERASGRLRALNNQSTRTNDIQWSPGSRFLSYTHGGQIYRAPNADPPQDPYELWCLDVPSRREHLVIRNPALEWSWTYHGQILCSSVEEDEIKEAQTDSRRIRPTIWAVNAGGGAPQKLFMGGYSPHESPDGRWVAFYDWPQSFLAPQVGDDPNKPVRAELYLFDRKMLHRERVGSLEFAPDDYPASQSPPLFQWSPDGRSLMVLTTIYNFPAGDKTATLYKLDLASRALTSLHQWAFKDGANVTFRGRGTSADGRAFYLEQITNLRSQAPQDNYQTFSRSTLISVDISDGTLTSFAELTNAFNENPGWDFHEDQNANPAFRAAQKLESALRLVD